MEGANIARLIKPGDRAFTPDIELRLVDADGNQVGVVKYDEARRRAIEAGLDLVIVAEKAEPPVCRIMDFGKLQYEQKKSLRTQKKHNQTQKVKEVKFRINIDPHDYSIKINHAVEFLEKGNKVKATLTFRGREMAHKDIGFELVNKVIAEIKAIGEPESTPKLLGRNITVNFNPVVKKA